MKLLFVLVALGLAGALPGVQSCCYADINIGDGNWGSIAFQRDLHFDRVPAVLTPTESGDYLRCRQAFFDEWQRALPGDKKDTSQFPEYTPYTNAGDCNLFGCNCDHCYGAEDCKGTSDGDPKQQLNRWQLDGYVGRYEYVASFCPALRTFVVPGFTGTCVTAVSGSAGLTTTAPAITAAERACADRDKVLNATLPQLTAALSSLYCAKGAADSVGLEFTGSLLASLDADGSGSVDCAEWGIAKQTTELHQLAGGGYFGPSKLEAPLCKLNARGREALARYNAYLGKLTLGTLATNATALAASAASRAAVTVENDVVAGPAAGALLAARDKVAAAWNATAAMAAAASG